uniref:Uncharacterized protein n=1 Tax=Moniliophthora roreri TaxID=221103 RepID=A0A0W0FT02_MONRR
MLAETLADFGTFGGAYPDKFGTSSW